MENIQLENHFEIDRFPWFTVEDDRIHADPELAPALDFHTHLAMSMITMFPVDLHKEHTRSRHYLPLEHSVDFDVYQNKNFSTWQLWKMKFDLSLATLLPWGMRRTHTAPNLAREMQQLGITRSVLLPVEFRRFSDNTGNFLDVAEVEEPFIPFGSVHPQEKNPLDRLQQQEKAGIRGVKIHPSAQNLRPDHPEAMEVYDLCGELDLPVIWHGGPVGIEGEKRQEKSQIKHYWPAVREHPGTTFIMGHSGALQWEMALELAKQHDNLYMETSCQSLPAVRTIVEEMPKDRILFGSDWPFYHQSIPLAKVALATEDDKELRRAILWENAVRLLDLSSELETKN